MTNESSGVTHFHFANLSTMTARILQGPKLTQLFPSKSLGQLIYENSEKYGDQICQIDGNLFKTETYSSCKERSTRVALELKKRGITSNDLVAFCSSNTLDTQIPIIATLYLGAKIANLESSLSIRQTQHLIALAKPKIIFVEEASVSLIEASLKAASCVAEIVVYGQSEKYATLSEWTTQKPEETNFKPSEVDVDDVAILAFSSGTSGLTKAICHTHQSIIHGGSVTKDVTRTYLHFHSLYWIGALRLMIVSNIIGGIRIFYRSIEPENIFNIIAKYKVDTMLVVPYMTDKLANFDGFEKYDTSSLEIMYVSGSPMTAIQAEKVKQIFKHSNILNTYGQTETGILTVFHPVYDQQFIKEKPASCGKPFYETSIKIVDEDTDEILGPNQRGEIRVKTPGVMKGYYNLDASEAFDREGFLKTGDVGFYDEDGCLYIVERSKEMFRFHCWQIVPSNLEEILLDHPAVKEAAVFGVPLGDDGEVPGAYIVLKNDANATREEIFDFFAERVPEWEKLLGGITFVASLPRTPTGKLARKEIKNLALNSSCNN